MSDDDYEYETESKNIEMQASYKDTERVSLENVDLEIYIDILGGKQNKLFKSDIKKFVENVYSVTKSLMDINILFRDDLKEILDNMIHLKKPGYKNATAYVLGYIASNGGNKYDKDLAKTTFSLLNKNKNENKYDIEDKSINLISVVRYSILWLNMKNKL